MKKAVDKSFVSDFGFESPNFSVDKQGNITANSVNLTSQDTQTEQEVYDFTVTDNGANFIFLSRSDTTPTLNLEKGKEYSFDLKLVNFTWNLKRQDQETDYIEQITHSSGETGSSDIFTVDSQNRIDVNIAGNLVGDIDSQGSSIPVKNTNIDNTTINNSAIGQTLPNVAAFTTATVNNVEDNDKSITNKKYVDTRDIAFSIAFGL